MAATGVDLSGCPQAKKCKLDDSACKDNNSVHKEIRDLSLFEVDKILSNNTKSKTVCLQGSFKNADGVGLVILEKTAFEEENLKNDSDYFTEKSSLKNVFFNDIYGNYEYHPKKELNALKATIIHPATEKHIQKYSIHNSYMVDETPQIYEEIVCPFLEKDQFDLQWCYNILEHKSETDRIVCEDPDPINGFILLPDLKWNNESIETLYLLAVTNVRNIKSLRDLTADHLPLLKNIQKKCEKAIEDKYGLDPSQLRVYFHYQPSFYHLHIHFTYLRHEAPGILVERAHLLSTVISNIELLPDYYQKATLSYVIRENDNLFKEFESKGLLKRVETKVK